MRVFLNPILSRFHQDLPPAPQVDCRVCARAVKCCDFQPFVANFLLGAWLQDREELPQVRHAYWHPLGLIPARAYRENPDREPCSFYSSGACTIYAFRPGECGAYFCDGISREAFATRVFDDEVAIAQMALVEFGLSGREIGAQVDLLNAGAEENATGDLLLMYKAAWNWSQTITPETLKGWRGVR